MLFDVYSTVEEALRSFGWRGKFRSVRENPLTIAANDGNFKVLMRQIKDITILDVQGRLDMNTGPALGGVVRQLQDDRKKILFNFENVTVDSCGLGQWISAHTEALRMGVRAKYILSARVRAVLNIVKLM